MVQSRTKTFNTAHGPCEFTITQLTAMRSGKLLMRLLKTIGPGLAGVFGSVNIADAMAGKLDTELRGLPDAVRGLFENLTGDELEYVTRELLASAQVNVQGQILDVLPQFDLLMQGHVFEWFKLLWFAIEVNYGNFTGALAGLASKLPKGKAAPDASKVSNIFSGPQNG